MIFCHKNLIAEWNKLPINNGSSLLGQLGRQHLVSRLHRLPRLAVVVEGELVGALGEGLESGVTHLMGGGQHQGGEEEQAQRGDQDLECYRDPVSVNLNPVTNIPSFWMNEVTPRV